MNVNSAVLSVPAAPARVNWKQVGAFLGLTFFLTWFLDLVLYLVGGLKNPAVSIVLQFQMLLPAFSAMLLGVFVFANSPIYFRTHRTVSRWFVYYYLLFCLLYFISVVACLIKPELVATLSSLLLLPGVIGLVLLLVLRAIGGKGTFASVGMGGGKPAVWALYGLLLVAYYGLQTFLNYVFKLGTVSDITSLVPQLANSGISPTVLILSTAFNAVLLGPFLGLMIAFGEEYGWRGYLQTELQRLGRIPGTALLGVIWGIWHWPVIWMGYNFPGQPILGSLLMVIWCIELAFFLAYAVYKSKGVWTAAYLHALNNQTLSFMVIAFVMPTNIIMAFGAGIPALVLGAVVIALLLMDPLWREE
jgi:membrane protease YdiL (CAAX protease family)